MDFCVWLYWLKICLINVISFLLHAGVCTNLYNLHLGVCIIYERVMNFIFLFFVLITFYVLSFMLFPDGFVAIFR